MFFLLLIFICQYLYINYILNIKNPNIVKTAYNYRLKDDDTEYSATIYHTNKNAKKVILFFFYYNDLANIPKSKSVENCIEGGKKYTSHSFQFIHCNTKYINYWIFFKCPTSQTRFSFFTKKST